MVGESFQNQYHHMFAKYCTSKTGVFQVEKFTNHTSFDNIENCYTTQPRLLLWFQLMVFDLPTSTPQHHFAHFQVCDVGHAEERHSQENWTKLVKLVGFWIVLVVFWLIRKISCQNFVHKTGVASFVCRGMGLISWVCNLQSISEEQGWRAMPRKNHQNWDFA